MESVIELGKVFNIFLELILLVFIGVIGKWIKMDVFKVVFF